MIRLAAIPILVLAALAAPRAAAAASLTCDQAEADSIDIDGMLDDWQGVARARAGGTAGDASFDVRCLFDGARLYVSVDVRDEKVLRQGRVDPGKPGAHDHLAISIPGVALTVFPGVGKQAPVRLLGTRPADKGLAIEDTLQRAGWSVEIAIPAKRLQGWSPGSPAIAATIVYRDNDVAKLAITENEVSWAGNLTLGAATDLLTSFLGAARLSRAQVTLDAQAEVDRSSPGKERVVAGADVVGLLTQQYSFVKLPVQRAADVVKVELVDLRGDGSRVIAAHVRQRGGGGVRDLLTFWIGTGGQLDQIYAIEIGKEQGGKRLKSSWKVEPATGWRQAKGARRVLVVRAEPAVGWDEDSYAEAPAPDAEPIHVPWDDDRNGGVFWLNRHGAFETAPLQRSAKNRK